MATFDPNDPRYHDLLGKALADWQKQVIDMLTMPNPLLTSGPTAVEVQAKMAEARKRLQDKQDKFYQRYSSGIRNIKDQLNGKYRRPNPQAHGNPAQQSDPGDDGADSLDYSLYSFAQPLYAVNPKPRSIPYAGIRTGEIIGHRAWLIVLTEDGPVPRLCSLAHKFYWPPGGIITGDIDKIVQTDQFWLAHIYGGVYAFASPEMDSTIVATIEKFRQMGPGRVLIGSGDSIYIIGIAIGTVEMWGDVVEHETGYRASHAKLKTIDKIYGDCGPELRSDYGV